MYGEYVIVKLNSDKYGIEGELKVWVSCNPSTTQALKEWVAMHKIKDFLTEELDYE